MIEKMSLEKLKDLERIARWFSDGAALRIDGIEAPIEKFFDESVPVEIIENWEKRILLNKETQKILDKYFKVNDRSKNNDL